VFRIPAWLRLIALFVLPAVVFGALGTYALKVLADVWNKLSALVPTQTNPAPAATSPLPPAGA